MDRVSADGRTTVLAGLYYPGELLPLPDGFACGEWSRLVLGSADGEITRAVNWYEVVARSDIAWSSLATDAGSGRLAVAGRDLVVLDRNAELVASRRVYGPLRACLEHRFGAEIAVGPPARPATRDDDIAVTVPVDEQQ